MGFMVYFFYKKKIQTGESAKKHIILAPGCWINKAHIIGKGMLRSMLIKA
jgi:hypothetical protein